MRKTIRRRTIAPLLVALALGGLAACGDDDDSSDEATGETTEPTEAGEGTEGTEAGGAGDVEAYCEAELALETAPEPDIDFETATPEEQAAAAKEFASETYLPLAEDVQAVAPEEVAEDIAVGVAAVEEVAETGDFGAFEAPGTAEALDRLHRYDLENCGWESTEVTGIDYAFEGIPPELPAGPNSFEFSNGSSMMEGHVLILARKNDGVTQSAAELLALPEEEARSMITDVGEVFAEPGGSDSLVVELEPGDYVALCPIPVGASEEAPEGTGPPHFVEGMVTEFTVS